MANIIGLTKIILVEKMIQEQYSLTWDFYSDHLREMLHKMMQSESLADVTLVTDDQKQFKVHQFVLNACSPVLKSIIENFTDSKPVIYLRGIQQQEIESILKFMYLGETTCNKDRIKGSLQKKKLPRMRHLPIHL